MNDERPAAPVRKRKRRNAEGKVAEERRKAAVAPQKFRHVLCRAGKGRKIPGFRAFLGIGRKELSFNADETSVLELSRGLIDRDIDFYPIGPDAPHGRMLHPGNGFRGRAHGGNVGREVGLPLELGFDDFLEARQRHFRRIALHLEPVDPDVVKPRHGRGRQIGARRRRKGDPRGPGSGSPNAFFEDERRPPARLSYR